MEHNVDHSLLYSLLRFLFGTLLWKQFCSKGIAHIRWRILPNSPFVLNGIVPWYLLECFSSDFQDIWPICLKFPWLFLRYSIIPKFNFSFSWKFAQEKPEIEYTLLKLHHLLVISTFIADIAKNNPENMISYHSHITTSILLNHFLFLLVPTSHKRSR